MPHTITLTTKENTATPRDNDWAVTRMNDLSDFDARALVEALRQFTQTMEGNAAAPKGKYEVDSQAIKDDYDAVRESDITLTLDNETLTVPVTPDNIGKLTRAFTAATEAAQKMAATGTNVNPAMAEDVFYHGVSEALKKSLSADGLVKK